MFLIALRKSVYFVYILSKLQRGLQLEVERLVNPGGNMNTRTIINITVAMTLVSIFTSCAPSSSENQSFSNADQNSSSIIGGVSSSVDYQKESGIVGLLMVTENDQNQQGMSICTGSLIQKNVVLTAAHCITLSASEKLVAAIVFFGPDLDAIMSEMDRNDLSHVRAVTKAIRHENYLRGVGTNNDIALIKIQDEAPEGFKLAQLAPTTLSSSLKKGSLLTLAGFGVSSYKMNIMTRKPVGDGDGLLRRVGGMKVLSVTTTNQEMTLDQTKGKGACHGDSGGPAYLVDAKTKKNYLVGVTSRGDGTALCDKQVIYTNTIGYNQWIADNTKKILETVPVVVAQK